MSLTRNPKQETRGKFLLLFKIPGRNIKQAIGKSMLVRCTGILRVKGNEKDIRKNWKRNTKKGTRPSLYYCWKHRWGVYFACSRTREVVCISNVQRCYIYFSDLLLLPVTLVITKIPNVNITVLKLLVCWWVKKKQPNALSYTARFLLFKTFESLNISFWQCFEKQIRWLLSNQNTRAVNTDLSWKRSCFHLEDQMSDEVD